MKLIIISDTHGLHSDLDLPQGDVLIHAGDLTRHGNLNDVSEFNDFLGSQPHPQKIIIAGNHDYCFEKNPEACRELLSNCIYLQDQEVTLNGVNFYGSPWQPWFFNMAFNLRRGANINSKWLQIPKDVQVLITHGPPYGIGDLTTRGKHVGCADLLTAVNNLQPKLHIFGHIHEGYGITVKQRTTFINASSCNERFQAVNDPIIIQLEPDL